MIAISFAGPSIAVPAMAHAPGDAPPYWISFGLPSALVLFTGWSAAAIGAIGVGAGLLAVYRGARFPVKPLLAVSFIAVGILTLLPPAALALFLAAALLAFVRMPDRVPGLPAVSPALALSIAWIFFWPFRRPWYDVMIIALLALYPSSSLDVVVLIRLCFGAITYIEAVHTLDIYFFQQAQFFVGDWLTSTVRLLTAAALIWICVTGRWGSALDQPSADMQPPVLQPNLSPGA